MVLTMSHLCWISKGRLRNGYLLPIRRIMKSRISPIVLTVFLSGETQWQFRFSPPCNSLLARGQKKNGQRGLIPQARARPNQLVVPINRLIRRPKHSPEKDDPEKRIIKGPVVMAKDTDKDPSLALFAGPEKRVGCAFLDSGRDRANPFWIAGQFPITFIVKVNLVQISGNGVVFA